MLSPSCTHTTTALTGPSPLILTKQQFNMAMYCVVFISESLKLAWVEALGCEWLCAAGRAHEALYIITPGLRCRSSEARERLQEAVMPNSVGEPQPSSTVAAVRSHSEHCAAVRGAAPPGLPTKKTQVLLTFTL